MARLHRRYRRNSSSAQPPKHNPPLLTELAEFIGPGFVGFSATRLMTRIAATQVAKYKPSLASHAGAVTSIGAFLAAWFLAHRWKWLARWQQPLVVGAGLAALQSLLQLYLPKLGWIVSDASPEIAASASQGLSQATVTAPSGAQYKLSDLQPSHEDPNEFTYNDSYDPGRMSRDDEGPSAQQQSEADMLADIDTHGTQAAGIFSN